MLSVSFNSDRIGICASAAESLHDRFYDLGVCMIADVRRLDSGSRWKVECIAFKEFCH
jgi:hypothetical protein